MGAQVGMAPQKEAPELNLLPFITRHVLRALAGGFKGLPAAFGLRSEAENLAICLSTRTRGRIARRMQVVAEGSIRLQKKPGVRCVSYPYGILMDLSWICESDSEESLQALLGWNRNAKRLC